MMQQSYHAGGDFDAFHQTSHRNVAHTIHYDRATPYGYYEPRHELRQDFTGRISTHTSIQEPDEPLTAGGQARRRIAVAVSVNRQVQSEAERLLMCGCSAVVAVDGKSNALVIQEMAQDARRAEALA